MNKAQEKIVRHLREAHSTELALVRALQAHIAMSPGGQYRTGLQQHLETTRQHAELIEQRLDEVGASRDPVEIGKTIAQGVIAQGAVLAKGPLDMVRGGTSPEKLLKNAFEESASEAWEIAQYEAIERLANNVGDTRTAQLAAEIRADEEQMLEFLREEIKSLSDAVARADIPASQRQTPSQGRSRRTAARGRSGASTRSRSSSRSGGTRSRSTRSRSTRSGSSRSSSSRSSRSSSSRSTGGRATSRRSSGAARNGGAVRQGAKQVAKQARRVPGVSQAEGEVRGAVASERDLPIAGYGRLNADEVVKRLSDLTQVQLSQVDAYERRHENRTTVLERIDSLRGREPIAGYDELSAEDIRKQVSSADEGTRREVRDYERSHKNRDTVLSAVS